MATAGAAAGIVALVACGGDDPGEQVASYIREANRVQSEAREDYRRANAAYVAFARGKLRDRDAVPKLVKAERTIAAARARLAGLDPPQEARGLHARLLVVLDRNLALARETTRLARYQEASSRALRPLSRRNRALSRELRRTSAGSEQAEALARFARALDRTLSRLREFSPAAVIRPAHRDLIRRLSSTRRIAGRLEAALQAQASKQVAGLLLRFRDSARANPGQGLRRRSLADYNRRYRSIAKAQAAAQRERLRLERSLD